MLAVRSTTGLNGLPAGKERLDWQCLCLIGRLRILYQYSQQKALELKPMPNDFHLLDLKHSPSSDPQVWQLSHPLISRQMWHGSENTSSSVLELTLEAIALKKPMRWQHHVQGDVHTASWPTQTSSSTRTLNTKQEIIIE